MFLVACSFSNQNILAIFKTNTNTFKIPFKLETFFEKIKHFLYVLTNENYYKVYLNDGAFSKYFQKPHKANFQIKVSDLASN